MNTLSDSPIVVISSRVLSPFIQLFALYVIFHGHYSPGGGFQGGAMLAASVLLTRLSVGGDIGELQFPRAWSTRASATGVLIYAGVGLVALLVGGRFLDYSLLPLAGLSGPELRSMGILLVEVGVGMGVMGTLIGIFDDLMEGEGGG